VSDSGPTVSIRRLGPSDAEAYRALRLEALAQVPEAFGASHEEEAAYPMDIIRARLPKSGPGAVFGGFADDRLLGMAGFLANDRIKQRHKGVLWGVFVRSGHRTRGVGEQLVRRVITHAAGHVILLHATVVVSNASARRLYARLGFREYGIERMGLRIGDTFHDEVLIALDLRRAEVRSLPA
jgi:RimJ/RimL family protein N-acetyltransferase